MPRLTKEAVRRLQHYRRSLPEGELGEDLILRAYMSQDFQEGVSERVFEQAQTRVAGQIVRLRPAPTFALSDGRDACRSAKRRSR